MLIRPNTNQIISSPVNRFLDSDVTYLSPSLANCDRIYNTERQDTRNNRRSRARMCICAVKTLLDSTTFCYSIISIFMISVGVIVLFITSKERDYVKNQENYMGHNAQLWIIGPIFLAAGLLICVKGTMHLYKDRRSGQDGPILALQNSQSTVIMPPSYSNALLSPMPHRFTQCKTLATEHYRKNSDEAPPPSYWEALRLINSTVIADFDNNRAAVHGMVKSDANTSNADFYVMHD